jgi:hypothetical protein
MKSASTTKPFIDIVLNKTATPNPSVFITQASCGNYDCHKYGGKKEILHVFPLP